MSATTYPDSLPVVSIDEIAPVSARAHAGLELPSDALATGSLAADAPRRLMLASSITGLMALVAAAVGAIMLTR